MSTIQAGLTFPLLSVKCIAFILFYLKFVRGNMLTLMTEVSSDVLLYGTI